MATVKQGSRGADVAKLQNLLSGFLKLKPALKPDGDIGRRTQAAVIQLQKQQGLDADGIVGRKTWNALGQKFSEIPKAPAASNFAGASWMAMAVAELGVHEDSLLDHHTKRK